uniref:Putative conserved secreted protein n=1 Tax=Ixodes ricinus TaxID=34613 RepID=A0A6B0V387_IXORI
MNGALAWAVSILAICGAQFIIQQETCTDLCRVGITPNDSTMDCRNQLWEHRKLINLTITPCNDDPCIYRKHATYEISFYAVANYSQKFWHWWSKGIPHVNQGKLMGGLWLEQHTEDLRAFGEEVTFNFTNPDVDMPLRVKPNETFKIKVRLCRKFHPYDFKLKIFVGTWQHSFGCCNARVNVTREWKKCLNYDDDSEQPSSTEKPRSRAEL